MAQQETNVLNRWRLKWATWACLFRNNVGAAWAGIPGRMFTATSEQVTLPVKPGSRYMLIENPQRIEFGLGKGSLDFVGWKSVLITADMVGRTVAVHTEVEGKTEEGRLTDEQKHRIHMVRLAGGFAFVVRDENTKPTMWD